MGESLYHLLGVDRDADVSTIRRAYRERAKEHHPDVSDEPGSVTRFKRLTTARDVLADAAERARYDRLGHDAYVAAELDADRWTVAEDTERSEEPPRNTAAERTSWTADRRTRTTESPSRPGPTATDSAAVTATSVSSVGPTARYRGATVPTDGTSTADRMIDSLTTMGPWVLVHAVFLSTAAAAAGVLVVRAGSMPILSIPLGSAFFGLALFLSALHVVSLLYA